MSSDSNNIIKSYWQDVWKNFINGDTRAFDIIYKEQVDFLYKYGLKIKRDTSLIEDSIQDLFLYIISKKKEIVTPENIRFYLLTAFRRILLEKIYKEKNYIKENSLGSFKFDFIIDIDEIRKKKLTEAKIKFIEDLIESLDSQKKEIIYLKFHSGLSYTEIAEIAGIKSDSVKKMVYRIIFSFRKIVEKNTLE